MTAVNIVLSRLLFNLEHLYKLEGICLIVTFWLEVRYFCELHIFIYMFLMSNDEPSNVHFLKFTQH